MLLNLCVQLAIEGIEGSIPHVRPDEAILSARRGALLLESRRFVRLCRAYKHLERIVSFQANMSPEVLARTSAANRALGAVRAPILSAPNIEQLTKDAALSSFAIIGNVDYACWLTGTISSQLGGGNFCLEV